MSKYVSLERIQQALPALQRGYPPAVLAFLAMKKAGVGYGDPVEYGSPQENQLLESYFLPTAGAPQGKKFYIPFSASGWVNEDYSGSTLQRARTSQNAAGTVFANGLEHPKGSRSFKFKPTVLEALTARFPKTEDGGLVRIGIADLLAWMRREEAIDDDMTIGQLVDDFCEEFSLSKQEFEAVFSTPDGDEAEFFADEPVDSDSLVRLLGGRLSTVTLDGREDEFLASVEVYLAEQENFILPKGFVRRFFAALKAQGFVIISGKPGTGKTQFIKAFLSAMMDFFQSDAICEVFQAVSPEFSESDVVGYENLEGEHVSTTLVKQLFDSTLAMEKRGLFFLVLDEFNLANADRYLARVLPGLENDKQVYLPAREPAYLPPDVFVVATANSYLDEPTRLPISGPVLRRSHVIEMPNALTQILNSEDSKDQFVTCLSSLVRQSLNRISDRAETRGTSFLDESRKAVFADYLSNGNNLPEDVLGTLFDVCVSLAAEEISALTFGVLQDVVDYILLAGVSMSAVDEAIVQKVLPQARGPASIYEALHEQLVTGDRALPDTVMVLQKLLDRTDGLTGEIQPLV